VISHLAIFAAMRPREMLALPRRHIGGDSQRVIIEQRVYLGAIDTPKTHSSR
jgi:hypothetical protein